MSSVESTGSVWLVAWFYDVAKAHGEVEPGDFKSVVRFLTKRIIGHRLSGDLFASVAQTAKRVKGDKSRAGISGEKSRKAARHK